MKTLKIASRTSQLAIAQSEIIKKKLLQIEPKFKVEIIGVKTLGDKILDKSLAKIGGKGLFVKELEQLLLNKSADIAVHSMKDVPAELPDGLAINSILERETALDAFVSNNYNNFKDLPANSKVGTSSLRRKTQLKKLRSDLEYLDLRGNVNTRLDKLSNGEFDAIILARCGLKRLNLEDRIKENFNTKFMLPAACQGALGIESRITDNEIANLIKELNHPATNFVVQCERAVTKVLDGGCQAPIAAYATILPNNELELEARVMSIDAKEMLISKDSMPINDAVKLGESVANNLLAQGALSLIDDAKKYISNQN